MDALALAHDIVELPPEKQKEVVAVLHERIRPEDKDHVPSPVVPSSDESVFGMWADRKDMNNRE